MFSFSAYQCSVVPLSFVERLFFLEYFWSSGKKIDGEVPWWLGRLRTWCRHCCGAGSISGPRALACHGHGGKKRAEVGHVCVGTFTSSTLFYYSMSLSLHQYYAVLITTAT